MSLTTWTTDQMLSLAPDALLARAAERMANPHGWLALGHAGGILWGEFPNANSAPYHVLATLPDLAFYCDCPARKRPCRHAVSLALMAARESASFSQSHLPEWAQDQLGQRPSADTACDPPDRPFAEHSPAYQTKLATVRRGMNQFERWLKDTVHGGLADLPALALGQWNEMASRLSDAGAPEVAQDLHELRKAANGQPGWPEAALRRLGRFYLLTQGFAAYDSLPPEAQADLRGAVGWFEDLAYPGDETVDDEWLILGTVHDLLGQKNIRRTWLYGRSSRRFAFVEQELRKRDLLPAHFSGAALRGTLRFVPGGWPQRAVIENVTPEAAGSGSIHSFHSLRAARDAYGKALSVNPWLRRFPLPLSGMRADLDGSRWVLRDSEGYMMPLPHSFLYGWHVQIMGSSERDILFGEWDGQSYSPLSAYHNNSWLALRALRGQK